MLRRFRIRQFFAAEDGSAAVQLIVLIPIFLGLGAAATEQVGRDVDQHLGRFHARINDVGHGPVRTPSWQRFNASQGAKWVSSGSGSGFPGQVLALFRP